MSNKPSRLDEYSRRARLFPALLAVLPVPVALLGMLPKLGVGLAPLWALISWCGGSYLLAQLGRDLGKKKEHLLFVAWGGKPTTLLLRRSSPGNPRLAEQYRNGLQAVLHGQPLPSSEEEAMDSHSTDNAYDAAVGLLREATRDCAAFPLVFEENCNYGFRRNLWGLKPTGIALSASSLVLLGLSALISGGTTTTTEVSLLLGTTTAVSVLLLLWVLVIKREWVRTAAFAYAERLLGAASMLSPAPESPAPHPQSSRGRKASSGQGEP